jgi:hypothetical protein
MPGIAWDALAADAFDGFAKAREGLAFVPCVADGFFDAAVELLFAFGWDFVGDGFALVGDGIGIFMPGIPGM